MADQVQQTIGVVVSFISTALAAVTGKKLSDEKTQEDEDLYGN